MDLGSFFSLSLILADRQYIVTHQTLQSLGGVGALWARFVHFGFYLLCFVFRQKSRPYIASSIKFSVQMRHNFQNTKLENSCFPQCISGPNPIHMNSNLSQWITNITANRRWYSTSSCVSRQVMTNGVPCTANLTPRPIAWRCHLINLTL